MPWAHARSGECSIQAARSVNARATARLRQHRIIAQRRRKQHRRASQHVCAPEGMAGRTSTPSAARPPRIRYPAHRPWRSSHARTAIHRPYSYRVDRRTLVCAPASGDRPGTGRYRHCTGRECAGYTTLRIAYSCTTRPNLRTAEPSRPSHHPRTQTPLPRRRSSRRDVLRPHAPNCRNVTRTLLMHHAGTHTIAPRGCVASSRTT